MTNLSTQKRERQILVARERNRIIKSKVHTAKRRVLEAMEENKRDLVGEKFNTFMSEVDKAVKEVKQGKIDFKVDKFGIIHSSIGKVSFEPEKIIENAQEFINTIIKMKPASAKGQYVKSLYLSSTMGPGLRISKDEIPTH